MLNLLLSPNGRMNAASFMKSGFILILIGMVPTLVQMINRPIGSMFGFLGLLLVYPWACVWIKRLHQGGKSGWMTLLFVLIYVFIFLIAASIVMLKFGGEEFMTILKDKMDGNISKAEYQASMEVMAETLALPMLIAGLLSSLLTLFIGDKTIGHDPDENDFGAPV